MRLASSSTSVDKGRGAERGGGEDERRRGGREGERIDRLWFSARERVRQSPEGEHLEEKTGGSEVCTNRLSRGREAGEGRGQGREGGTRRRKGGAGAGQDRGGPLAGGKGDFAAGRGKGSGPREQPGEGGS